MNKNDFSSNVPPNWYLTNGFISGTYEVRFFHDKRMTVCVIRSLKKLDEIYTGVALRHPKDRFDDAIGRHKAFKKALECEYVNHYQPKPHLDGIHFQMPCSISNITFTRPNDLPVSQIQKDYWTRYEAEEK